MSDNYIFAGQKCPCAEFCPFANDCKQGGLDTTPFLKELGCLHSMLWEMAKEVQKQETRLPRFTVNETFFNALWLFRGAIEKAAKATFNFGDIQHNFQAFDKIVWTWEKTINETQANFLKESFLPLRSQIRIHDKNATSSPPDFVFGD